MKNIKHALSVLTGKQLTQKDIRAACEGHSASWEGFLGVPMYKQKMYVDGSHIVIEDTKETGREQFRGSSGQPIVNHYGKKVTRVYDSEGRFNKFTEVLGGNMLWGTEGISPGGTMIVDYEKEALIYRNAYGDLERNVSFNKVLEDEYVVNVNHYCWQITQALTQPL